MINLREDYGSTWDGDMIIKNCTWYPADQSPSVIFASNTGHHDFGYQCQMPSRLFIENLRIMDGRLAEEPTYSGPTIFNDYDGKMNEQDDKERKEYPYITTKELHVNGIFTESGKEIGIKRNPHSMPELKKIYLGSSSVSSVF